MKNKTILFLLPVVILAAAIPGLVALNLLVTAFPSWVMWIPAVLLAAAVAVFCTKSGGGRGAKIALSLLSAVIAAAGVLTAYCLPYWSSVSMRSADGTRSYDTVLTLAEAQEDMAQLRSAVNRVHPRFINGEPAEFTEAFESASLRLEEDDSITVSDLYRELQRTLSVLGDGHTNAYSNYGSEHYLKTIARRQAEGMSFHAVNGMTAEQLFEERRDLFCYEADSWGILCLKDKLSTLSGLAFLGIDPEGVEFTWINEAGESVTDTHTAADFITYDEYAAYNAEYFAAADGEQESFVSYEIDRERNLALLTLTNCRFNDQYKACLRDLFAGVKTQGIDNVAVDLRGNGGGSSLVANEFIRYLPVDSYNVDGANLRMGPFLLDCSGESINKNRQYTDLVFDGEVYLLTDSGSFSSAMMFAEYIKDNKLGTIIGEPPGNDPNGCGDVANFRLDNSGLYMSVSTKQFFRPDRECTDKLVMPDVECEGDAALEVLCDLLDE